MLREPLEGACIPADLQGLLQTLETGEAAEAAQPPGLTVPLRAYQRQSLKFMQDAEACEGGFGSHLWAKVCYKSTVFWWSPILRRACLEHPACETRGGFLAGDIQPVLLAHASLLLCKGLVHGLISCGNQTSPTVRQI